MGRPSNYTHYIQPHAARLKQPSLLSLILHKPHPLNNMLLFHISPFSGEQRTTVCCSRTQDFNFRSFRARKKKFYLFSRSRFCLQWRWKQQPSLSDFWQLQSSNLFWLEKKKKKRASNEPPTSFVVQCCKMQFMELSRNIMRTLPYFQKKEIKIQTIHDEICIALFLPGM